MSSTSGTAGSVDSIPKMKEDLRKSFEVVKSHFPRLIPLQWKDLDDHFSSIEKSVIDTLAVQARAKERKALKAEAKAKIAEAKHRQELRSLCAGMEYKRLRVFISGNIDNEALLNSELAPALRSAPDPALLVINAMAGFHQKQYFNSKAWRRKLQNHRRTCLILLRNLRLVAPVINASVRDKAKALAFDWRALIRTRERWDKVLEVTALLHLIMCYDLVSAFGMDDIWSLFRQIPVDKEAVELIKGLNLVDKLPDLIWKLNSRGKQLDSLGLVLAFNMVDKYPPITLLEAYVNELNRKAQEGRDKNNNPIESQAVATSILISSLKKVLKTVAEHKLSAEYPCGNLVEKIAQLEQQETQLRQAATAPIKPDTPSDTHLRSCG